MSSVLRSIEGWKQVAGPTGRAASTRLRVSPDEDRVLGLVVDHVAALRRRDLAVRCAQGVSPGRQARAERKRALTAESSSRWAGSIVRGNDAQAALSRRCLKANITQKKAAIATIKKRLALPTRDQRPADPRPARGGGRAKKVQGYANQDERFQKQRRLQHLESELARAEADHAAGRFRVVDGGRRLLDRRHQADDVDQWRREWEVKRRWVRANGSNDEPFGNLTITVTPEGRVSIRLPRPLEHLANAPHSRFELARPIRFSHGGPEWADQVADGRAISYTIAARRRDGWDLTASWTLDTTPVPVLGHRVLGIDTNGDHLACWVLDRHGNPVGKPITIATAYTGTAGQRDALVRQTVTRIIHLCQQRRIDTIVIEDLDFADARKVGRETMGRGRKGKRFRRIVAGLPTAQFRDRLAAATHRAGIALVAVNPAYTSQWGKQHWLQPLKETHPNVTAHHSAAVTIGRRGLGHRARRRAGVTAGDQRIAHGELPPTTGPKPHAPAGMAPTTTTRSTSCRAAGRAKPSPASRQPLPGTTAAKRSGHHDLQKL